LTDGEFQLAKADLLGTHPPDEGREQCVYDLAGWSLDERHRLTAELDSLRVPYRLSGDDEMLVPTAFEQQADVLFDTLCGPTATAAASNGTTIDAQDRLAGEGAPQRPKPVSENKHIVVRCPDCGTANRLTGEAGQKQRCAKCKTSLDGSALGLPGARARQAVKGRRGLLPSFFEKVILTGLSLALVAGVGFGVISGFRYLVHSQESKVAKDVAVTSCGTDPFGSASAGLVITNHSSGLSIYEVEVEFFNAAGVNVSNGTASVNDVPSHESMTASAYGTTAVTGPLTCKITSVTRLASP
jgi:ribosomal protein S27E